VPEVLGALRPPRLAAAPSSPARGELYFDSTSNTLFYWNGTAWISAGGAATPATPVYTAPVSAPASGNNFEQGILQNMPRFTQPYTDLTSVLTSGTVRFIPLGVLRAGQATTAMRLVTGAGAATTATNVWGGIATWPGRVIRGISATNAFWNASGTKGFTFTSPYTPAVDELLVAFVMYQGAGPVSLLGVNVTTGSTSAIYGNTNTANGPSGPTGQSTAPAVGATLTAAGAVDGLVPYCYLL
jgi:hypothetical protein